jgi:hypothetical protein
MKKELIQNILADDKGSEVFFETVMQEKVEELKELRKKDIARKLLTEDYVVEVTTKDGEIFRTGKMKTEKEADKKHWKLAKGNKYKSVKVVKEEDLEESDQRINLNKNKQTIQDLEKLGVKNVYRKHPLPIQREKMLRDAANAGLIKLK